VGDFHITVFLNELFVPEPQTAYTGVLDVSPKGVAPTAYLYKYLSIEIPLFFGALQKNRTYTKEKKL